MALIYTHIYVCAHVHTHLYTQTHMPAGMRAPENLHLLFYFQIKLDPKEPIIKWSFSISILKS